MAIAEAVENKSRLSQQDEIALKTMSAEDQKLIARIKSAFAAYEEKVSRWCENPTGREPELPAVIRFAPYLKKFDGGVQVNLWPGSTSFNRITGEQDTIPSTFLEVKQDGYTPKSLDEALRLLVLARMPNHRCGIVTWDQKEMAPELKKAELENAKHREELAKKDEELAAARAEIERLKKGVK